jgi:hypothetical protein
MPGCASPVGEAKGVTAFIMGYLLCNMDGEGSRLPGRATLVLLMACSVIRTAAALCHRALATRRAKWFDLRPDAGKGRETGRLETSGSEAIGAWGLAKRPPERLAPHSRNGVDG